MDTEKKVDRSGSFKMTSTLWGKWDTKKVRKVDKKANFYDGTLSRAIKTSSCIPGHLPRAGSPFALENR
jgi:hypothetical protein